MAEAFRSGLESVETIQRESAISLGMSSRQTMQYVILPQALATSVPAICSECYFPAQRNQCIECHQSYGFNIYGERPDRSLL